MSKGRTIALSLYDEHIEVLDRLAKRQGSRSGAVQRLLEEARRGEIYRELDEAYRERLEGGSLERDRQLTEEMLSLASWPPEWQEGVKGGNRRGRRRRKKGTEKR